MQIKENNLIGKIKQRVHWYLGQIDLQNLFFEGLAGLISVLIIGLFISSAILYPKDTFKVLIFFAFVIVFILIYGFVCELIRIKFKK